MLRDPVRVWRMRRPLLLFSVCLTAGMTIGYQNAVGWYVWLAGLIVCAAVGIVRRRGIFLFAGALLLGAMLVTIALIRPEVQEMKNVQLTGRVVSEAEVKDEQIRVKLDRTSANGEPLPTRIMLYLYGQNPEPAFEYGSEISVEANLSLPRDANNPLTFSYDEWMWREGAALVATAQNDELTVTAQPGFSLIGFALKCRGYLQKVVNSLYGEEAAPLVSALLLGNRSMLPDELYSALKTAGLSHLLAISGLHISCLAMALDWLLRRMRCPGRIAFVLTSLFLAAYALMIGFPASVIRAALMYMLSAGARLTGRPSDGLTGLSLALAILLVINPLSIADVSLILSFSSVGGILALTRPMMPGRLRVPFRLQTPLKWVLAALAVSLAAQLGTLPAVACCFGSLSTYSLAANLPVLPLITAALPGALVSVAAGCISLPLGRLLAVPVGWALHALTRFAGWIASLPGAVIDTPVWPVLLTIAYASVCLLCSPVSGFAKRARRLLLCALPLLASSALLIPETYPTDGLEVLFLDVGQADGALVRAEDRYYLVDTGEGSHMAEYLQDTGIRPTAVFLSHPHADHAGGLADLMEICSPMTIYVPCLWDEVQADEGVPEVIHAAKEAGWRIEELEEGDSVRLSAHVTASVVQPWPGMTDDANGASMVLHVKMGGGSVLFTGDLPSEDEQAYFPDCDVLKVAHHGSGYSTSSMFLSMTSPSAAVISVGRNSYGHPAEELMDRLQARGIAVYRTDECGAVRALLGPDGLIRITPMQALDEAEEAA